VKPRPGRPRLVTTEQVVAALDSSRSLRHASDKLGVWHGAIVLRSEPEILAARERMNGRRLIPHRSPRAAGKER
jgi:hypothetical protein